MCSINNEELFDDDGPEGRHLPKNRGSSASKQRRNPANCPVCLEPLRRTADGGRLRRSCIACGATIQPQKRCSKCQAQSIWEGRGGAACRSCGLHGRKESVIAVNDHGIGATLADAGFLTRLAVRFPDIAASVDECSLGLLHLEMGIFASATQQAISAEDVATVQCHFEFVDELLQNAGSDLVNAINVSYLEHLSFDGRHGKRISARELLSLRLQKALSGLETYLE